MGTVRFRVTAYDADTGEIAWECTGPDERGACTRVPIGSTVPCVQHDLVRAGAHVHGYRVPPGMSLCPITLALATAASCEALVSPN